MEFDPRLDKEDEEAIKSALVHVNSYVFEQNQPVRPTSHTHPHSPSTSLPHHSG